MDSSSGIGPLQVAEGFDHGLFQLALFLIDWDSTYRERFVRWVPSPDGDLLVVHIVHLDAAWRGFGLEAALTAEAIWSLADGCCAVVADLHPDACPDHGFTAGMPWPPASSAAIGAVWEEIGFRRLPSLYLLDTAEEEPRDLRRQARSRLAALNDAYPNHR
ncbi:hypothetical protein [Streptomyces cavernae]|uniref:hypothetical protein n=1 Tax=Streptomyces cavernae TaxID=2259034 RepID=UPI000FEBBE14|nr:hypothetical protein [Streptomyces cavernae]